MRMAKFSLAVLALLLPSTAWSQANFNIPPDWQHNQQNGMQIFRAPGRNEGFSINPAPGMASLGAPEKILETILNQYQEQYPELRILATCTVSPSMAMAFFQRSSAGALLGERMMVGTGQGTATVTVLWAPAEIFAAEDLKITGGNPACPPRG